TVFDIQFSSQSTPGTYTVAIGPAIADLAGNNMDQNQNGVNGETTADKFSGSFTINPPPPNSSGFQFDFGTASSPVETGFTQVTDGTTYGAGPGYGWSGGTRYSYDRGTGSNVNRDFVYTADSTFLVDVANGVYSVTVTLGDVGGYAHDLQ